MATAVREVPIASGGVPVVGHLWQLLRDPLGFVTRQGAVGDVVAFRLGRETAYLVTDPDLTVELLVDRNHAFTKGPLFEQLRTVGGNSVAIVEGDTHLRQRRLMQPLFHRRQIGQHVAAMRNTAAATAESWRGGQVVDMRKHMYELAVTTVTRALSSRDIGIDAGATATRCIPVVLDGMGMRVLVPFDWLFALPTPGNRRFTRSVREMVELVDRFIAAYRADGTERNDLLSMLMSVRYADTGETMTDQQVRDEVITLFTAASETTSAALAWLFHILGTRPDVDERVNVEVEEVLAGEPVDGDTVAQLDYVRRVVTETLRLYPPSWLLPRGTRTDIRLGGYRIPAGATVFFTPYGLHHDRRWFVDPERFDPDRWLPDRAERIPRNAYLPFATGAHRCLGEEFARTEMVVTVATIVRRWRLRPVSGFEARPVALTTLYPRKMPMLVEPRR